MWLDIKNTVWERVHFDSEEQMNEVIEKLKTGEFKSGIDVCDYLAKSTEWLDYTSEELSVEENDGLSTIEIMLNGDVIWENGTETIDN
jgi:hypothetical protein